MGNGSKISVISSIFVLILLLGASFVIVPGSVSADPTVPSAPTGLTATPGDRQVVLTWNAPSDDGGSPITSYNMWRGTTPGGEVLITSVGNALTFTCTGRTNGVTYYFKITAVNAIGDGPPSNEASATPMAVPYAPTGLTATPGNAKVVLKWTAPSNECQYLSENRVA
jgi:predicted phage tail protein